MNNIDSRLQIEIGIDDSGDLFVVDQTPYEQFIYDYVEDISHVVLERVVEYSEDDDTLKVVTEIRPKPVHSVSELQASKTFELPNDGMFHYQKIILPTEDHRSNSNIFYEYSEDDKKGHIYLMEDDETGTAVPHEIDFTTAYDYVNDVKTGNAFWFDDYVFTIYNLIKCFVLTEKQRIANWLKNNCKADCDITSSINTKADILMAAVTVLTYLISNRQFLEAYRLLNGLRTCNSLCEDFVDDIKGCGCGKSV